MPDETPATPAEPQAAEPSRSAPKMPRSRRAGLVLAAAILVAAGATAGAAVARFVSHREAQQVLPPVAISAMTDGNLAAVKGKVVEIFGNKFVVEDQSGRALVETGPSGEDAALVARDEPVTVQGLFEHGFIHGSMITHADGRTDLIGPPDGPPRHGPHRWFRP